LDTPKELLATLGSTLAFDLETYLGQPAGQIEDSKEFEVLDFEKEEGEPHFEEDEVEEDLIEESEESIPAPQPEKRAPIASTLATGKGLDAAYLKTLFATESYKGMKGILGELADSLALNQRFMFTKELFDGNADLLRHALKSVDELNTFEEAVDLINARFVVELGWDIESEEVREFMQQVYRKFVR
jgi:hypothetical protein